MFISKNAKYVLSDQIKDYKVRTCEKCQEPEGDPVKLEPAKAALKILNRALSFQIDALMLNSTENMDEGKGEGGCLKSRKF